MFARITQWVFVGVLLCTGIALVLLGGYLVYLGGSAYYIAAGLVTLLIVFNLVRKRAEAPRLYAALLGVTVVWSVYEAELDFLALLPRQPEAVLQLGEPRLVVAIRHQLLLR